MSEPERSVRAAFAGGPVLLDELPAPDRESVLLALGRHYVGSCLAPSLIDGVLLFLGQFTRRRYPLYLHAAKLIANGATDEVLLDWLDLSGWEDPGALIAEWRSISPASCLEGVPPVLHTLVGRTVGLLAHSPSLGGEVVGALRRTLPANDASAVLGLVELWAALGVRYRWLPRFELGREPLVKQQLTRLHTLLTPRVRVASPIVPPQPGLADSSESLLVSVDVAATVLEALPIGVLRLDSKGRIGYENPAMREILGVPTDRPSVAHGMRITDLPNMRNWTPLLRPLIDRGESFDVRRAPFVSVFGKAGVVNVTGRAIRDTNGLPVGSVLLVVDARREVELENQVVELGQREMFAGLVSRIGHDLNNLLVGVRGNAALLGQRLQAIDPHSVTVVRLDEATQRLSALVDGLLELAHPSDVEADAAVDLGAVVRGTADLLLGLLPDSVALRFQLPEAPLFSLVRPGALRQVLLNLCVNARDGIVSRAPSATGSITIELSETLEATESGGPPSRLARLTVTDDGTQLSQEQLLGLFDPIESTRSGASGLGLGMPVSRALIVAHGGTVSCRSREGGGLVVTLELPAADAPLAADESGKRPPGAARRGRVLVVEDNDVVRDLCVDVLQGSGHSVRCVASGRAALAELKSGEYDVALLDVGLPDISGVDVVGALGTLGVAVPVILTSGNTREALGPTGQPPAGVTFLRKPFMVRELLDAVEAMLVRA